MVKYCITVAFAEVDNYAVIIRESHNFKVTYTEILGVKKGLHVRNLPSNSSEEN